MYTTASITFTVMALELLLATHKMSSIVVANLRMIPYMQIFVYYSG